MVLNYLNTVSRQVFRRGVLDHYRRFNVRATIRGFQTDIDDVVYEGCPREYCKKKLQPSNEEQYVWYCEKCNLNYRHFKYRYKLKVLIQDESRRWPIAVTMFDYAAIRLLGISARDLVKVYKYNQKEYDSYFDQLLDQTYYFTLLAALVLFKDRRRMNGIIARSKLDDY